MGSRVVKIKFIHDEIRKTLTIWFNDPSKKEISEVIADKMLHVKDASGRVIGIEVLNYDKKSHENYSLEHIRKAF